MNKSRRKRLEAAFGKAKELKDEIEAIKDEEQEAHDNLPESLQYAENGENMQGIVDDLDYAFSSMEDVVDNMKEAIEKCDQ